MNKLYIIIVFNLISCFLISQKLTDLDSSQIGLVEGLKDLDLQTGDLVMFQSKVFLGKLIQLGTLSPYTHCALIIKNPDSSLYLLHATENDYNGFRIPVIGEDHGRPGVILTKLEDLFLSIDSLKSGYYKHIRIIKMNDRKRNRPIRDTLLSLYQKYKNYKFPHDKTTFVFSSLDLNLFGKDLLSKKSENSFICSGLAADLLYNSKVIDEINEIRNEYTPMNIRRMEPYLDAEPIIFKFKDGKYRITYKRKK
jgi:hypothetical protein